MFEIKIADDALFDLDSVIEFYSNISIELGEKFIKIFDKYLLELESFAHFQIRYDHVRIRQVKPFPIIIHYTLDEDKNKVTIYGVRFAQQNPKNYPKT